MDESAQQAVQIGVNITIFVIALSLGIRLMMGVKNVAEKAIEYDASIPTGSRTVVVEDNTKRVVTGDEIMSYYVNYIQNVVEEPDEKGDIQKRPKYEKFSIIVKDKTGGTVIGENSGKEFDEEKKEKAKENKEFSLKQFLINNKVKLAGKYEVITEVFDEENEKLTVSLKEI